MKSSTFLWLLFVICLICSIVLVFVSSSKDITGNMQVLCNVILFILTSISSVILGSYFAKVSSSEKIDTIATSSTEKMVHLTIELNQLNTYLKETEALASAQIEIGNDNEALSTYRHRGEAASQMTKMLAKSNETFRNDWLGVVSYEVKREIIGRYEKLNKFMSDTTILESLLSQQKANDVPSENLTEEIEMVENRIKSVTDDLPITYIPKKVMYPLAVRVKEQFIKDATNTRQTGTIVIEVLKEGLVATGSGKFNPLMNNAPTIQIELLSKPVGFNTENIQIKSNTGTNFDFHINLKSKSRDILIPVGEYKFNYTAQC